MTQFAHGEREPSSPLGDARDRSRDVARRLGPRGNEREKMSRRADLFDLTNVSPLCVSRAAWLSRGKSGECDGDAADGSFPFSVSPTAEVYAARRARDDDGGDADAGRKPATTCVAVVKSVSTTSAGTEVRVVVPEVKKRDDDDEEDDDEDDDGIVEEEDTNAIFEARLRAAMDAESKGVSLDRMFGVKGGVQNSPVRTSVSAEEEEEEEEVPVPSSSPIPAESPVIDAMDIDANAPVFIAEAASPVGCAAREPEADDLSASDAAFERMLARAMTKPETPVEKQPLERAVPKKTFEPKLLVKSPEKYEPAVKPTVSTASSLDFEAKLEAALRAAEAGGDLTAILSGPSQKTMHSPAGANDTAESRVNYRELGFTRAEREHHRLHVAENDAQ